MNKMLTLLALQAAFAVAQDQCTPTPIMGPGPLYTNLRPHVKDGVICAPSEFSPVSTTKVATSLLTPRINRQGNNQISITGKILDEDCNPVAGALIDVWQTSPVGVYKSVSKDVSKGDCRGYTYSTEEGSFELHTQTPGSYGLQLGAYGPIHGLDFPVWGPRHIHVAIQAPGYLLLTTELHFDDDIAVGRDWRSKLEPTRPDAIVLPARPDVTVNLVLTRAISPEDVERSHKTVTDQISELYCNGVDVPQPHFVCRPELFKYVDPILGAATLILVVVVTLMGAVVFCLFQVCSLLVSNMSRKKTKVD